MVIFVKSFYLCKRKKFVSAKVQKNITNANTLIKYGLF